MEDNSYVSLSLEKYNELYDKAKKFDELTGKFGNELEETISSMIDNINKTFYGLNKDTGEVFVDDEEELKVGDKVELIKTSNTTNGFDLGDICTIVGIDNITNLITINKALNKGFVSKEDIKKIKEENNYGF